jgi:Zn-dependent membrane protease YugP
VEFVEQKMASRSKSKIKTIDWKQKVIMAFALMFIVIIVGTIAFMYIENLLFSEALYFCVVTTTSVG